VRISSASDERSDWVVKDSGRDVWSMAKRFIPGLLSIGWIGF